MKPFPVVAANLCVFALLLGATEQEPPHPPGDDALAVVREFVTALGNADLDGLLATFEENATVFMPIADAPTRLSGKTAIREGFRPFLDRVRQSGKEPPYMTLTPRDLQVQSLGADACVVTCHLGALPTKPVTRPVSISRRTFVLKRIEAGWRIIHLHASNVVIER